MIDVMNVAPTSGAHIGGQRATDVGARLSAQSTGCLHFAEYSPYDFTELVTVCGRRIRDGPATPS